MSPYVLFTHRTGNMLAGSHLSETMPNKNKKSHPVSQVKDSFPLMALTGQRWRKPFLKVPGSLAALQKSLPPQTEQGTQTASSSGERNNSTGSHSRERLKEYLQSWGET